MKSYWDKIRNMKGLMDLTSIGIANIVGSAISAIFWFYLASIIETEVYGEISYLIAIAGIASVISLLGSSATVTVYTAKNVNILPALSIVSISTSFVAAIALLILFENPSLSIYTIGYVIFNLGIGELLGRKYYKTYSKLFILQKILLVVLALIFYYIIGPHGVILGFGLSFLVFSHRIVNSFRKGKVDFSVLRPRRGFIINSYILDLARVLSNQTDKLIIAPVFGLSLLGNYHLGIQFLSLLSILPSIVMQYTLPQDASGNSKGTLKKITIGFSVIFAIIGIFVSPVVIPELFPKYESAVDIVQIISVAVLPRTISLMLLSKFLGTEKSKWVVIGIGIFLTVQIPSLFILGEMFSVKGIAWSLVLAETSQAVFLLIVYKYFQNR